MYAPEAVLPEGKKTAGDFFSSLAKLKAHYGLELRDDRRLPYPYNVLLTLRELARQLRRPGRSREVRIVENDNGSVCLTVSETLQQRYDLYYIPVKPLYDLWQQPQHQSAAELLTAVCAYLYYEAGVSYYRDEGTYMGYNYEILGEWIMESGEEEESVPERMRALADAEACGDFLQERMQELQGRDRLESLLTGSSAVPIREQPFRELAHEALVLWQAFSGASLYDHVSSGEDGEDDDMVAMHEWVSFIGSDEDALSEDLLNMVNTDFNERPRFQEPEVLTLFDRPLPPYADELAYAERLFKLIDDLCTLLNNLS